MARGVPDFEFDGSGGEITFLGKEGGWGILLVLDTYEALVRSLVVETRVYIPPIVGSLFSWKSLLTKRITREDYTDAD